MHIFLLATSRGKELGLIDKLLPKHFQPINSIIRGGAQVSQLKSIAFSRIQHINHTEKKLIVLIAGIPNITKMIKDKNYEEVIFIDSPDIVADRLKTQILDLISTLKTVPNTYIVVAPVLPTNISKWNHTRLSQGKTQTLKHTPSYNQ